jgi:hypothetical protein
VLIFDSTAGPVCQPLRRLRRSALRAKLRLIRTAHRGIPWSRRRAKVHWWRPCISKLVRIHLDCTARATARRASTASACRATLPFADARCGGAVFPFRRNTLSFREIADHWSLEIPLSQNELLKGLEGAWWLGEICGISGMSRLEFLKYMFTSMAHRDDLGIVFVVDGNDYESPYITHPDGRVSGPMKSLRHQVPVPSGNIDSWNESSCDGAFYALAQTSSRESYPEPTYVTFFDYIELSYDEFIGWLNRKGSKVPEFWQPLDEQVTTEDNEEHSSLPDEEPMQPGPRLAYKALKQKYPDGRVPKLSAERLAGIVTPIAQRITGNRKTKVTRESVLRALDRKK